MRNERQLVFLDTETTGLPEPDPVALELQPHIIEVAAIKCIDTGRTIEEVEQIHFTCKPPIRLPPKITKITGITQKDLAQSRSFAYHSTMLANFMVGVQVLVAHNAPFDKSMLRFEYTRLGRQYSFPWPPETHDTVEIAKAINGKYNSLMDLYSKAFQTEFENHHRAMSDAIALLRVYQWLRKKGHVD